MSNIKSGVYASIGGTVGKVFQYSGNKTGIEVHVQTERMKHADRYTVWDLQDQVAEGDAVEVHGWLTTAPETYQKRDGSEGHGVKRTINAPKLAKHEPAQGWGGDDGSQPF